MDSGVRNVRYNAKHAAHKQKFRKLRHISPKIEKKRVIMR